MEQSKEIQTQDCGYLNREQHPFTFGFMLYLVAKGHIVVTGQNGYSTRFARKVA